MTHYWRVRKYLPERFDEENPVAGFYADFDESTNTVIIGRCMTDAEAK